MVGTGRARSTRELQRQRNRGARRLLATGLVLAGVAAGAVRAEEPSPPSVGLDRLLQIPDGVEVETPRRGGATRSEWQARFRAAQLQLEDARAQLEKAQEELEDIAQGQSAWQITAPGAPTNTSAQSDAGQVENSPMNYRLHQSIRHAREDMERAERRLQELVVEANLAGVPPEWQNAGEP